MKFLTNGSVSIGVFWGVSLTVLVEFWTDFFGPSIQPSETLVATILGAAIALSGTLISVLAMQEGSAKERHSKDEATVHTVLAKLLGLNDTMLKNSRHFMTMSESTRVFIGENETRNSFSKPLEGKNDHVTFTAEERAVLLRLGKAEFFNSINDMQGVSDSFTFLHARHLTSYYSLLEEVQSGAVERAGYAVTGALDRNSPRLIAMMDADGVFRSFLDRSATVVEAFTVELIEFANKNYGTGLGYFTTDTEPSPPSHLRSENF